MPMTVPAGGAPVRVLPALICLGDTIRMPDGIPGRVISKAQEPGLNAPFLLGYKQRGGGTAVCPFPADMPVTLLHSAGSRAA